MSHWRKRNLPAKRFNSNMVRLAVGLLMLSAACIGVVFTVDHGKSGPQRTASNTSLSMGAPGGQCENRAKSSTGVLGNPMFSGFSESG
jgi:hypothetical protein